jgi:hypothetical protein
MKEGCLRIVVEIPLAKGGFESPKRNPAELAKLISQVLLEQAKESQNLRPPCENAMCEDFYQRFISLCAERGETPTAVSKAIGLSNAAPSMWKRGATPNDSTIARISLHFGVSPLYFKEEGGRKGCRESGR